MRPATHSARDAIDIDNTRRTSDGRTAPFLAVVAASQRYRPGTPCQRRLERGYRPGRRAAKESGPNLAMRSVTSGPEDVYWAYNQIASTNPPSNKHGYDAEHVPRRARGGTWLNPQDNSPKEKKKKKECWAAPIKTRWAGRAGCSARSGTQLPRGKAEGSGRRPWHRGRSR